MFGQDDHDDNKPNDDKQHDGQAADDVVEPAATSATDDSDWQHPGSPPDDNSDNPDSSDSSDDDNTTRTDADSAPPLDTPDLDPDPDPEPVSNSANNDLIDLKQEALTKLSPLVDKLDQAPDEKFRTLMMMIQASDDQSLVKHAYETAQKIDDEKERAQALLDIVNEINYFTQNSGTDTPTS